MKADWSFLRRVLEQGAAIQQDYAAGKYPTYEHYAARMDEAARERADQLGAQQPASGMVELEQKAEVERLQARIDALMLEYCPDEITPEQLENWGKHQRPEEIYPAMAKHSQPANPKKEG